MLICCTERMASACVQCLIDIRELTEQIGRLINYLNQL